MAPFFQIAACACSNRKAYLESVEMAILFPFPSSKARVRAMSSANWVEVPGDRGLASMISKLETTAYLALLFPSKTKLLLSVYQISSGLIRGSSDNPSWGFVQWSKVFRQEWNRREPSGVGRRVAGLRTSQGDIVRPGFSISVTWYLRILWSDIHKWPLPLRSCFTWWLLKIVSLPPKESFKASSIMIAIAARFQRQGGQPWAVGSSLLDK